MEEWMKHVRGIEKSGASGIEVVELFCAVQEFGKKVGCDQAIIFNKKTKEGVFLILTETNIPMGRCAFLAGLSLEEAISLEKKLGKR